MPGVGVVEQALVSMERSHYRGGDCFESARTNDLVQIGQDTGAIGVIHASLQRLVQPLAEVTHCLAMAAHVCDSDPRNRIVGANAEIVEVSPFRIAAGARMNRRT